MKCDWLSIIIPTLNEAQFIHRILNSLHEAGFDGEIILADGGSTDETISIARQCCSVRVLHCSKANRGAQMNAGAQLAQSSYLFFLHADSIFPVEGLDVLSRYIEQRNLVAGSFYLKFDNPSLGYKILSLLSRLNLGISSYGDQGLVIQRDIYAQLEGFRQMPLLEDVDIIRRIKKDYSFQKLPIGLTTSARRFERQGLLRQLLINAGIMLAYYVGVSPEKLARFYQACR